MSGCLPSTVHDWPNHFLTNARVPAKQKSLSVTHTAAIAKMPKRSHSCIIGAYKDTFNDPSKLVLMSHSTNCQRGALDTVGEDVRQGD